MADQTQTQGAHNSDRQHGYLHQETQLLDAALPARVGRGVRPPQRVPPPEPSSEDAPVSAREHSRNQWGVEKCEPVSQWKGQVVCAPARPQFLSTWVPGAGHPWVLN